MEYYEDIKNFKPMLDTAISLMRSREKERICQLILHAEISVGNTEYDNWNGGTYGYTVFIDLPVSIYATLNKDEIAEIEKEIGDTLNEVTKGDNSVYFGAQIAPKFTNSDIDWGTIGGEQAKQQLRNDLESIKDILISVATGGPRIQDVDDRYKNLHNSVVKRCKQLSIRYDNGFASLWDWYGRWRDNLPSYQSRRDFVSELLKSTFEAFSGNEGQFAVELPLVGLDEWGQIKRLVVKIKRDSNVASNEEDFQQIGLLCREVIISLAQVIYNPIVHGDKDEKGTVIGKTDAVRMIGNYLNVKLAGSSNEELRSYAKTTNKLANMLTHKRDATKKDMMMTVAATIALINFVGILEDKG